MIIPPLTSCTSYFYYTKHLLNTKIEKKETILVLKFSFDTDFLENSLTNLTKQRISFDKFLFCL